MASSYQHVDSYIDFQSKAHSPFHVVSFLKEKFTNKGLIELDPTNEWSALQKQQAYFVIHPDGKTMIAFRLGDQLPHEAGMHLIGSHTDSPAFRLKSLPFQITENCVRLATQKHGGIILRSWLDRPLLLAGSVFELERSQGKVQLDHLGRPFIKKHLVQTQYPIGVIPDLAIHLDRDKNTKGEINSETMMRLVLGMGDKVEFWKEKLAQALGLKFSQMDGFELSLAPFHPTTLVGLNQEFILGPRHDDLAMVFSSAEGFLTSLNKETHLSSAVCFFDAEETGSQTASGAHSHFIKNTLEKLILASLHLSKTVLASEDAILRAFCQSFLISADMAHGVHPGASSCHDDNHRPLLNKGMVLKENANDSYATSGFSSAYFKAYAEKSDVPLQYFVNRQDMGCGSTIGPITAAKLGCHAVDIGAPMWGMHSSAETMGALDLDHAVKLFSAFL